MSDDIGTLENLVDVIVERCEHGLGSNDRSFGGRLYCTCCMNIQRHSFDHSSDAWASHRTGLSHFKMSAVQAMLAAKTVESIRDWAKQTFVDEALRGTCLNCRSKVVMLIHRSPEGYSLVTAYEKGGSVGTVNTPNIVKFFLDQAFRSANAGAHSAAVIMHRSALDALLAANGFTEGMCGKKIADLEAAIKSGKAPKWALDMDTEFFKTIKELGNDAGHPTPSNFSKQLEYDAKLYSATAALFRYLLDEIYEAPVRRKALHEAIKIHES